MLTKDEFRKIAEKIKIATSKKNILQEEDSSRMGWFELRRVLAFLRKKCLFEPIGLWVDTEWASPCPYITMHFSLTHKGLYPKLSSHKKGGSYDE